MKREPRNQIPQNVTESVRRRNPHLYGDKVGGLEAGKPKPTTVQALDGGKPKQKSGARSLEIVVTFTTHRARELDDDNAVGSLKPLRDAIAEHIGIDDGDKRVRWQYAQVVTKGKEGVHVTIERLKWETSPE